MYAFVRHSIYVCGLLLWFSLSGLQPCLADTTGSNKQDNFSLDAIEIPSTLPKRKKAVKKKSKHSRLSLCPHIDSLACQHWFNCWRKSKSCPSIRILYRKDETLKREISSFIRTLQMQCLQKKHTACLQLLRVRQHGFLHVPSLYALSRLSSHLCRLDIRYCRKNKQFTRRYLRTVKTSFRRTQQAQKLCSHGSGWACFFMARHKGLAKDTQTQHIQRQKWLRKGCQHQHAMSCYTLGYEAQIHLSFPAVQASIWLNRSCMLGEPLGCLALGRLFLIGQPIPQNRVAAYFYLHRACTHGSVQACSYTPLRDASKRAIQQQNLSAQWRNFFQRWVDARMRACHRDQPIDCFVLGLYFAHKASRAPRRSTYQASHWIQKACSLGWTQACQRLKQRDKKTTASRGRGSKRKRTFKCAHRNPKRCWEKLAQRWLSLQSIQPEHAMQLACAIGAPKACFQYAQKTRTHSSPYAFQRSIQLHRKNCLEHTYQASCLRWAMQYTHTEHSVKSLQKLRKTLRQYCSQGHPKACSLWLNWMYHGIGGSQDKQRAIQLHLQSCKQGRLDACLQIKVAWISKDKVLRTQVIQKLRKACLRGILLACTNWKNMRQTWASIQEQQRIIQEQQRIRPIQQGILRHCTQHSRSDACYTVGRSFFTQGRSKMACTQMLKACHLRHKEACLWLAQHTKSCVPTSAQSQIWKSTFLHKACSLYVPQACREYALFLVQLWKQRAARYKQIRAMYRTPWFREGYLEHQSHIQQLTWAVQRACLLGSLELCRYAAQHASLPPKQLKIHAPWIQKIPIQLRKMYREHIQKLRPLLHQHVKKSRKNKE